MLINQKFYNAIKNIRESLRRLLPARMRQAIIRIMPRRLIWFLCPDETRKGRILFVGNCYYNTWYLSRALRKEGWWADTLDIAYDEETSKLLFHSQDFVLKPGNFFDMLAYLRFYIWAIRHYDIFQFHGRFQFWMLPIYGLSQPPKRARSFYKLFMWLPERWDIRLLKYLGKKIVFSTGGCRDAVSPTSFRSWYPDESSDEPPCEICRELNNSYSSCSDEMSLAFGKLRNNIVDYIIDMSGNRKDYQCDPRVHDIPEFWCLDPEFWHPDLLVPANYKLPYSQDVVKVFHAVSNFEQRTVQGRKNVKCTHIYLPLIERLQAEGYPIELLFFKDVPNKILRYYQVQADIVVGMLTYGFFGANIRESLMLGKPCVCYMRQAWLENIRKDNPEYVEEIPVIYATPATIYDVLKDLITHPEKREEIGHRSREFALKFHSAEAGARRMTTIYSELLHNTKNDKKEEYIL